MEKYERRMKTFGGEGTDVANMAIITEPNLEDGEKEIVMITHDESTFYCNEGMRLFWMENGKKKLLPKCKGQSIMISGFLCACHGFMSNSRGQKSFKTFLAGKNRDGELCFNNFEIHMCV